jgi:hypothetical protein
MFKNSVAVLTPGRTGSVLLASYIARRKYQSLIVHLESKDDLDKIQWLKNIPTCFHSHNFFSPQELDYVTPIYSVRRNLVEALVSHALSNRLELWHLASQDQRPNLEPVILTPEDVDPVIESQQQWFDLSIKKLHAQSVVVVYEVMIDLLPSNQLIYQKTYPDKNYLISNYADISAYVRDHIPRQMLEQHGEFCDYPARVGVPSPYYQLLN